jgi:type IV pilus secretin PilQ/predicted competence protein
LRQFLQRSATVLLSTLLLSAFAPLRAQETPATGPAVTAIGVVKGKAGTQVTISGDATLSFEYFVIEGRSLVIDIPGATSRVWPAEQSVDDDFVGRVRVAEKPGEKPGVRIAFDLKRPDGFTVRGTDAGIVVAFSAPQPAPAARSAAALARVTALRVVPAASSTRVVVETGAKPVYRLFEGADPRQVTIAIEGASLELPAWAAEYANPDGLVTRVVARAEERAVIVAITLRAPAPVRVDAGATTLNVEVAAPPPEPRAAAADAPAAAAPRAASGQRAAPATAGRRITLEFVDADIQDILRLIADFSGMNIVATEEVKGTRSVKLTEVPWDQALDLILDTNVPQLTRFQESENVIRITTMQRVIDDRTAAERKKLELQNLADKQRRDGDEARIRQMEDAREMDRIRKRQEIFAPGLVDKTFLISYADITSVQKSIDKLITEYNKAFSLGDTAVQKRVIQSGAAASPAPATPVAEAATETVRSSSLLPQTTSQVMSQMSYESCPGCVLEVDVRTNTIFVRTYPYYLEQFTAVINALDKPTPAILIEARIVEVGDSNDAALGIQWGANIKADPAHGNALPYAFPNSVGISGTQAGTGGTYLVNLPAAAATSGVGISLGHIANTFSLDLRLSAMEQLGKTKVLSNPKLFVLQGKTAYIHLGQELPVVSTDIAADSTVAGVGNTNTQTQTVTWKPVGINLDVTPNVTHDNRVNMVVLVDKSSRGENVPTTEGLMFSINKNVISTSVLIENGATAVIGGLFEQSTTDSESNVPGLSGLPLVGWLFRSKQRTSSRKEILVFLTPKIISDARTP